jgi:hypothetical protein
VGNLPERVPPDGRSLALDFSGLSSHDRAMAVEHGSGFFSVKTLKVNWCWLVGRCSDIACLSKR